MDIWVMVVLVVLGLAAVVIEMFVPAGGLLGVLGGVSMVAGIVLAYRDINPLAGTVFLLACLIMTPTLVIFGFKIFPSTYMGKRLIMRRELSADAGYQSSDPTLAELVGQEGEALTTLRPVGTARIDGRRISVVTDGEMIAKKTKIRVIEVEGSRVVVERV